MLPVPPSDMCVHVYNAVHSVTNAGQTLRQVVPWFGGILGAGAACIVSA
jgi:hypothetical protein